SRPVPDPVQGQSVRASPPAARAARPGHGPSRRERRETGWSATGGAARAAAGEDAAVTGSPGGAEDAAVTGGAGAAEAGSLAASESGSAESGGGGQAVPGDSGQQESGDGGQPEPGEGEQAKSGVGEQDVADAGAGPAAESDVRVDARRLESALLMLRHPIVSVPMTLEAPGIEEARAERRKLLSQIDDYLLPRLRQSGAPILVALVGSTGAGKSTLMNSLAGKQVSATGIRRPTTNSPVLACHPADMHWFAENVFLPTLPRVRQQGLAMPGRDGLLVLAESEGMPRGVALLDTPDIDSVVQAHREFAHQFLDASDLWLFMTSARRYADAAVWELLQGGAGSGRGPVHRAVQGPALVGTAADRPFRRAARRERADRHAALHHLGNRGHRRPAARRDLRAGQPVAGGNRGAGGPARRGPDPDNGRGARHLPGQDPRARQARREAADRAVAAAVGAGGRLRSGSRRSGRGDAQRIAAARRDTCALAGLCRYRGPAADTAGAAQPRRRPVQETGHPGPGPGAQGCDPGQHAGPGRLHRRPCR